jgi:hypothetical protein
MTYTPMENGVAEGDIINVSGFEKTKNGAFVLPSFKEGADYCDLAGNSWMYAIVKERSTGQILAITGPLELPEDRFERLWLR